jgi:hypothetical protein
MEGLDAGLHRIGQHHFGAKSRLGGRDRAVVDLRGITTVRRHAEELVERGMAPAEPRDDGRQRPLIAGIACSSRSTPPRRAAAPAWSAGTSSPPGRALDDEQGHVVEAICRWIVGQYALHHPP